MADELRIGLQELLRKARVEHDADLLKEGVRVLSQAPWRWRSKSTWVLRLTSAIPGARDSATDTASDPGTRGWGPWS